MPNHPLAEIFGYPYDNMSQEANRHRARRLCPYNNKSPNCTKDRASDPLGVCSIFDGNQVAITCPIRFRENWIVTDDAASFFFPEGTNYTSLTEVRLKDHNGESAGNIDVVLVQCDENEQIINFGALEIQAVYISGNVRNPFTQYMESPATNINMNWPSGYNYPRPDYLSSSRKRLLPQLIYKGGILNTWNKKIAVALHKNFYNTLPQLPRTNKEDADIAWLVYDLILDNTKNCFTLTLQEIIYTKFKPSLNKITTPIAGRVEDFVHLLQKKIDKDHSNPPDAPVIFTPERKEE